ncbi:MAG: tetratricopeptide repeat protein [Opitutales bacterium]|nr:tetratricopeptide repeat protein [Opitutales bacterium]MCH8540972.1 tetratricopeptide repeat protein [Opitutales bacterium]
MAEDLATAQEHIAAGEWVEALSLLEQWSTSFPENQELLEEKAFVLSELGRHEESAEIFLELYQLSPEEPDPLLFAAREMEAAGNPGSAAELYRLYLKEDTSNATLWRITARLEEERGHIIPAIDAFRRSYQIDENDSTALRIGRLYEGQGNRAQADSWYRRAAQEGSASRPEALSRLARLALQAEDWEAAEELMAQIERENPEFWNASGLAETRQEIRSWLEAQEILEQQLQIQRQREIALQEAAEEYQARRAEEEARRLAAEEEARRAEEEARRAAAEEEARAAAAREEAEAAERAALEEESERIPEEDDQAVETTTPEEEDEETPPSNEERAAERFEEARTALERNDYSTARERLWKAIAWFDAEPEYWYLLAQAYKGEEAYEDAESTILQARRIAPDNLDYYAHYLLVARETRPLRLYIPELEAARERFPNNPDLMLLLAQAYSRAQLSREDAEYLYRRFLETADPDHDMRPEVEAFLRGQGEIPDGI